MTNDAIHMFTPLRGGVGDARVCLWSGVEALPQKNPLQL